MSFLDRFKKKPSPAAAAGSEHAFDELPGEDEISESATLAEAAQRAHRPIAPRAASPQESVMPEVDEGLPSVNTRKSRSALITILGVVFILAIGAAVGLSMDKKSPKAKTSTSDNIANNMPALGLPPPAPLAVPIAPAGAAVAPATDVRAKPIDVKTSAGNQGGGQAKQAVEWSDRKMLGSLVLSGAGQAGQQSSATPQRAGAATATTYSSETGVASPGGALLGNASGAQPGGRDGSVRAWNPPSSARPLLLC